MQWNKVVLFVHLGLGVLILNTTNWKGQSVSDVTGIVNRINHAMTRNIVIRF